MPSLDEIPRIGLLVANRPSFEIENDDVVVFLTLLRSIAPGDVGLLNRFGIAFPETTTGEDWYPTRRSRLLSLTSSSLLPASVAEPSQCDRGSSWATLGSSCRSGDTNIFFGGESHELDVSCEPRSSSSRLQPG